MAIVSEAEEKTAPITSSSDSDSVQMSKRKVLSSLSCPCKTPRKIIFFFSSGDSVPRDHLFVSNVGFGSPLLNENPNGYSALNNTFSIGVAEFERMSTTNSTSRLELVSVG